MKLHYWNALTHCTSCHIDYTKYDAVEEPWSFAYAKDDISDISQLLRNLSIDNEVVFNLGDRDRVSIKVEVP